MSATMFFIPRVPTIPIPDTTNICATMALPRRTTWKECANSAEGLNGAILDGWLLRHADKAARVPDFHAETPHMTRRAMDFMHEAEVEGRPWRLHLSDIKRHWPYIVSAPYYGFYGPDEIKPSIRADSERENPHPIFRASMDERYSRAFSREDVRLRVIPAYKGLIKQIGDELGLLFAFMKQTGLWDGTLIVFTSDHGDYLADHWLGEKYLFHEASVRAPLIVRDPFREADSTRTSLCDALVETIDLAPTFLEIFGAPKSHILEGRSLLPWLRGGAPNPCGA
jgi:arylsulfatase A-like enzyme